MDESRPAKSNTNVTSTQFLLKLTSKENATVPLPRHRGSVPLTVFVPSESMLLMLFLMNEYKFMSYIS